MATKGVLKPDLTFANAKDINNNTLAQIWPLDAVYGTLNTARTELSFSQIHRKNGFIQNLGQTCHSSTDRLVLTYNVDEPMETPPEPTPTPVPGVNQVVSMTFTDGLVTEIKVGNTEWKPST